MKNKMDNFTASIIAFLLNDGLSCFFSFQLFMDTEDALSSSRATSGESGLCSVSGLWLTFGFTFYSPDGTGGAQLHLFTLPLPKVGSGRERSVNILLPNNEIFVEKTAEKVGSVDFLAQFGNC